MALSQRARRHQVADAPHVDVVILTWNDGELLRRAVDSAHRSDGVMVRVIVIDNGSEVRPDAGLRAGDLMIRLGRNVGVAAGRNNGVGRGVAPFVCFLDSDAVLHPDTLSSLATVLDLHRDVALAAPVFDNQLPTESGGLAPTLHRKLLRLLGRTDEYEGGALNDGLIDVDFVIGACQLVRRTAFRAVGGLDERYFYGPEDADFGMRLHMHGWRVVQVTAAGCEHPPRRRNRTVLTARGLRHASAVSLFLWRHRSYRSQVGIR